MRRLKRRTLSKPLWYKRKNRFLAERYSKQKEAEAILLEQITTQTQHQILPPSSPERTLWAAVLWRAFFDASSPDSTVKEEDWRSATLFLRERGGGLYCILDHLVEDTEGAAKAIRDLLEHVDLDKDYQTWRKQNVAYGQVSSFLRGWTPKARHGHGLRGKRRNYRVPAL